MNYNNSYGGYDQNGHERYCDCPSCSPAGYDDYPNYGYTQPYSAPYGGIPYPGPGYGPAYGGYGGYGVGYGYSGFWYAIVVVVVILLIIFGAGGWNYVKGYLPKGFI
jgi:hypothetical protein